MTGWYQGDYRENADKCAWKYGKMIRARDGTYSNVMLNGERFLIQENWVNARGGYCDVHY
jgi:hypothetical protein